MKLTAIGSLVLAFSLVGAAQAVDFVDPSPRAPGPVSAGPRAFYDAREALSHMPPVPKRGASGNVCRPALSPEDCSPGGLQWAPVWGPPGGSYRCFDRQTADNLLDCADPDAVAVLLFRVTLKTGKKLPGCNAQGPRPK